MSLRLARVLVWTVYMLASAGPAAGAITLRYALVVGSNSSPAVELPRHRFAESEAVRLADALVRLGRFEPERVVTLQGPDRRSVEAAVATLLARRRQDETVYGNIRTVFAFFYSGHGLRGQLTLRDGPLGREALAGIFRAFPADFRMGFFDACYSAGLPTDLPRRKGGVLPLPGVSVLASLPQSIVQSRGSMWLMSSGPDEPSFEDSALGGVFTHFFIEAMTRVAPVTPHGASGGGSGGQGVVRWADARGVDPGADRSREMKIMCLVQSEYRTELVRCCVSREYGLIYGPKS